MLFAFTVNIKCRLMTLWWFVTLKCCRVAFRTYFHINITFTEHRSAGVNISVMVISSENKNWTFMGKDWHTDVIKCILFVALLHVSVNTLITNDERRRQQQRNKSTMSPKKNAWRTHLRDKCFVGVASVSDALTTTYSGVSGIVRVCP